MTHYDSDILNAVTARLDAIRSRWKLLRASSAALNGLAAFLLGSIAAALAETAFWIPAGYRVLLILAAAGGGGWFALKAVYALFSLFRRKDEPEDAVIASWVGAVSPDIRDRLRNAVQLMSDPGPSREGYSAPLKEEALREAAPDFLEGFDPRTAVSRRPLTQGLRRALAAAVLTLILFIPQIRSGFYRAARPFTQFQRPLPFIITLEPGDVTAVEGDTIKLKASTQGAHPREVAFHIIAAGAPDSGEELRLIPMGRDSLYTLNIPGLSASFRYYASSGRVKSAFHRIEVKRPPIVRRMRVKLIPPAYSKLPPLSLEDNLGDILALPGTEVEFAVEARGELSAAYIAWSGAGGRLDTIRLRSAGSEASGSMRLTRGGAYTVRLVDREGLMNRYPIEYHADILPDLPPMVDIVQPGEDLELYGTAGALKLTVEGEDDFGFVWMKLFYRRTSSFAADSAAEFQRMTFRFRRDPDGIHRGEKLWNLGELGLIPGDIVEYYAQAADNDAVNGPKTARSRTYILRLPSMAEMYEAMEQAESKGVEKLEKALEESRQIQKAVEEAIDQIRRKGELDWSRKRELEEQVKSQEEILKKLEEARESLEEIMERAEESSLLSMELMQKYSELQRLMSEIADPELQKAMERLSQAMEQADPEMLRQAAEMFQMSQEKMLEQVEKTLEIFKQLKLERKLEELAERAAEMAERQADIAEELTKKSPEEAAEEVRNEQMLKQDMEDFLEQMSETAQLAAEMDDTLAAEMGELSDLAEPLPGEMEQMSGKMLNGQMSQAQSQGQSISQTLSQLSSGLSQSKSGMTERRKESIAREMAEAVRDLVTLSFQQETLMEQSRRMSVRSPGFREGAEFQSGVSEGLESVTDRLFKLSRKTYFVTPDIGQELGRAAEMMRSALDNYTARNPRQVTPQQSRAMESMNRAAVKVLEAMDKMKGSGSSTGFEEMMEKLKQMADGQSNINRQSQSMAMPKPGQGGAPMPVPGAVGSLAAQQRALEQAMRELARQAQQLGSVMGDLGNLADEMGQSADSLEDRNIGERTLKLQERILSRLLDAQKSVRTQRVSKERRSRAGEDFTRRSPGDIPPDELEDMLRRDILRAMKEGYSPDYQRLIREYFRALYSERKQ